MSDYCSESDPCNFPIPSGGYETPFDLGEFLFVSGALALPSAMLTLAMACVVARKSRNLTFKNLLEAWLVPPSVLTAILLGFDMAERGFGRVFDDLLGEPGTTGIQPLIIITYLASLLATLSVYRLCGVRRHKDDTIQ